MGFAALRKRGRPKVEGLLERRREEILRAATEVFARRGFPGTDVQVVADRLGLSKGTIYRYFPTKQVLFLAAADRGMRLLNEKTSGAAAAAGDPLAKIIHATHAYLQFFDEHPQFVELIIQERAEFRDRKRPTYFVHRDANIGPWRKLLSSMIAGGVIRRMPVGRITDSFNAALYGAIFTNYFEGRRRSPAKQAWDILDVILQGILEQKPGGVSTSLRSL
jgi:AcrR family transcriptional regulator